ncbi:MAG: radical SAM protein [Nanoarchaeota archaeon]|nr:radical SAM protein [Nanoarchaeota archaeon]
MKTKLLYTPKYAKELTPEQLLGNAAIPPLGIASITAALRNNGYNCDQDDLNIKVAYDNAHKTRKHVDLSIFENIQKINKFIEQKQDIELEEEAEKILKKTKYKGYDLIGLSILEEVNPSSISMALALSKVIKEKTGSDVLLGGINYPRPITEINDFLQAGLVDYVSMGDGESRLLDLCYALENNKLKKFGVRSVFSKKIDNKKPAIDEYDDKYFRFQRPDFTGLPLNLYRFKWKKGLPLSRTNILALPYVFVKGCTYNCIFCPASKATDPQINEIQQVVSDLKYLSKKYKTKQFFFINSTINPSYDYAKQFVKEIKKEDVDIMWADCANFKGIDSKLLKGLKDAGAIKLLFGIESASEKMQKYILKNIDINKASQILKESHELGIWNEIELIAGMPYETDEDIKNTINFVKVNQDYLDYCYLNPFRLVDSLLLKKPEVFRITNIKDIMENSSDVKWFSRQFDETRGLKWKQKEKQILKSYNTIRKATDSIVNHKQQYFPGWDIRLMFYLYSVYDNKQEILDYFKEKNQKKQSYLDQVKYGISKIRKN